MQYHVCSIVQITQHIIQHSTTHFNTSHHNTVQHNTTQHNATKRNATQHITSRQNRKLHTSTRIRICCIFDQKRVSESDTKSKTLEHAALMNKLAKIPWWAISAFLRHRFQMFAGTSVHIRGSSHFQTLFGRCLNQNTVFKSLL